jgi:hypothetical protein
MKGKILESFSVTAGMFIYDLIVHSDQPIYWIKPVFVFCFILFISSLIESFSNKNS